ncbi:unnamed protein product [Schistosoma mattheei]|uniref:Uncharacterized protein n=1 Tax=Schistosoma mattheei TaxID=31246 RepID=A0A183Q1T7_9TREM|nr:unnamed protein product [Schistosoma mattheei]
MNRRNCKHHDHHHHHHHPQPPPPPPPPHHHHHPESFFGFPSSLFIKKDKYILNDYYCCYVYCAIDIHI